MASVVDITATTVWQSVNTLSGIGVGTAFAITHKYGEECLVQESASQPSADSEGIPLTKTNKAYAQVFSIAGAGEQWIRCKSPLGADIGVQE